MSTRALVCLLVVTALGGGGIALAGDVAADQHEGYVVEQGDQCVPVEPVSGTEPAEEFYGYRAHDSDYSSQAAQEYQDDDASTLVLYRGPEGLSLVIIHDQWHSNREDGTPGGTASFEVTGLPADGEWTVEDDDYDRRTDEFIHGETKSELHWLYGYGRTDGAVFTGLDAWFVVEIDPRFNDDARFDPKNESEDGEISDWRVITATENGGGFEHVSLNSLSEPVTIRPGSCADSGADRVSVEPDVDLGYGVDLASVWLTTDRDADQFDASVTKETDVSPPAFSDERTMFTVETDDPADTLVFVLRVDRELMEIAGLDLDDLVVFSHTGGEWTALDVSIVHDTDDAVYIRAEADADATIALGADTPVVTDVDVGDPVAGEPFDVRIVFENPSPKTAETTVSVLVDGEKAGEMSATIAGAATAETVFTTTVEEPGEITLVAGTVDRTIFVREATRELSVVEVHVTDDRIEPGEAVEVVAVVENTGTASAEYTANFTVAGNLVDVKTVTVESGERTNITFEQTFAEAGTYEMGVGDEMATVTVETDDDPEASEEHEDAENDEEAAINTGNPNLAAVTSVLTLLVAGTALRLRNGF